MRRTNEPDMLTGEIKIDCSCDSEEAEKLEKNGTHW